jgi:hypothetical protein
MTSTLESQIPGSFVNLEAQQAISPQLSSGERVLWAGRPRQGIFLQPQDAVMIPFSLAWCGFACFWTFMAWHGGAPWPMVIFGSLFVGVGLFMVFGRFAADARTRAKTFYAVTDQRVLFVTGGPNQSQAITSIEMRSIGDLTMVLSKDGRGSLLFGFPAQVPQAMAKGAVMFSRVAKPGTMVVQIERVKEVYDLIRKTKEAALEQQHA